MKPPNSKTRPHAGYYKIPNYGAGIIFWLGAVLTLIGIIGGIDDEDSLFLTLILFGVVLLTTGAYGVGNTHGKDAAVETVTRLTEGHPNATPEQIVELAREELRYRG